MTTIVTSEIVCAAFIGLLLFFQFVERNAEKSTKILRIIGVEVLLWLFIDVISFCTNLSYFPTFLAYTWGSIVALSFMYYCEAYIGEKTDLNPWIFRLPKFLCLVSITLAVVSFVTGNIVAYENGKATAIYGLPIEVEICQFIVIFYPSVVAFIKRKTAGLKSIILFGFFVVIPLFATVFSNWTENDYTIVFTAIALMAIAVFLQNERRQKNFEEHAAHEALLENSARFFALEDKFEALYDVDLKSGLYVSYSKGEFYQKAINEKLVSPVQFFENMRENVDRVVYEEDRESTFNVQQRESIVKELAQKDHIDHYYRIISENGLVWLKMRIVYKNEDKKNVIIGVFNADEEMAAKQIDDQFKQKLVQTNARLFALEDNFESLYDVELESGQYDVFIKGDFFRNNVIDKLSVPNDYFKELRANIDAVIYEEDRDKLYDMLTRESICEKLSENDHFDYYYRLASGNKPVWFKMRVVYKDADRRNVIIGVFNAAEEMAAKEKEESYIKNTELQLRYEQLREEILGYIVENDDDPIELLKNYAERVRELLDCDQIIYRDLKETRIMVNSKEFEKEWSVPLEYCQQCQHFDVHNAMYKDGFCEMENCQEGWHGIPVYHKCPIKSSLTRVTYCDGKVAGYLAVHYVQNYHNFTNLERETIEIFARILSISLSRFKAKSENKKLNSVVKTLNMTFALSDQFDPIVVINPATGEYDWLISSEDEVTKNTSMTKHGDNLYKNIEVDASSVIHEEDRDRFRAFYTKENLMKVAETGVTKETENRWYVQTQGCYRWKYNKVVRMIDDSGIPYVVIGVMDTTEKKEKENLIKETYLQLEDANRRNALLHKAVKASIWSYEIDENDEVVCAKYDDYAGQRLIVKSSEKPMLWVEDLHPDDRDRVFAEFMASIRDHSGNTLYETTYRLMKPDGKYIWLKTSGRVKHRKDGTAELFGISIDITNQIENERQQKAKIEESLVFTNFFLDTYLSAYYVNLENFSCRIYKRTDKLEKDYPIYTNYLDSIIDYINRDVHPEDRELLLDFVQPAKMKAALKEKKEYTQIFRDISDGVEKIYRMQVIRGSEPNHAAFGFIDITEEVTEQRKRQIEATETRKLIDGIAANYNLVYLVNMKTDTFKVVCTDNAIIGSDKSFETFGEVKEFITSLIPEADREIIHNEFDYETIKEKLKAKRSYDVEYRVLIKDAAIWHIMNVTYIDGDNITIGFANRDLEITQSHLEDKRYDEYFALYEIDIDTGMMKIIKDSPYYGIDRVGKVVAYKPAMLRFAYSLDEEPRAFFEKMADLNYIKNLYAAEDKRTYAYRSNNVGEKNWVDCTSYVTLRHRDGSPAMFTLGFSLLDSLGVYRQEIQKKYMEQNAVLVLQQELLESAREAADAANKAKSNFLFNMSHDIRTPMNAIRGFTSMAKKHSDNEEKVLEYLDKIDISGQQLLTLINQVLEMARIESGKVEFNEKPVSIQKEFNSMVTVLAEQADVKGLKFKCSLENVEHNYVLADEARLGSITLNIVGNAMKYTPEGGSIELMLQEVESRKPGYATYIFTVSDTGIGMSPKYLKELYEPFSREKSSTVSKIQGTGLGMSIVKNIIDLLGGNIEVQSELGKGTRFDITLDFKIDKNAEQTAIEDDVVEIANVSFKGRRVLLVEDNEMNREIAMNILEEHGFIVEDAEDGDVAVAMMQSIVDRGEFHYYDFILMDVQMPRMNGYEATKAIRAIPGIKEVHIPIIAMTANAFEEDRQNALAAGMDEHLAKPIDVKQMLRTIAKFLN